MNPFNIVSLKGGDRTSTNLKLTPNSLFQYSKYAVVSQPIQSGDLGRIYYQSTYWFGCALGNMNIPEGTVVEVIDRQGTTWLVKPVAPET